MEPNNYWSDYFTRSNNMEYFQDTNPTANNYHGYVQPLQQNGADINSTGNWSQNYYSNWNWPPTPTSSASNNGAGGVPVPPVQLNYIVNSNVVHNYGYGYPYQWPQWVHPATPRSLTMTPITTTPVLQEIQQETKDAIVKIEDNTVSHNPIIKNRRPTSLFKKSSKCECPQCSLPQDESIKGQPRRHGCLDNV